MGVLAVRMGPPHFDALEQMCVAGDVDIHLDRTYSLDEVPDALARVGDGQALGKVVVTP
jgi:NADPH:quinone reductase-like Zn-dependent oxidoreductase